MEMVQVIVARDLQMHLISVRYYEMGDTSMHFFFYCHTPYVKLLPLRPPQNSSFYWFGGNTGVLMFQGV